MRGGWSGFGMVTVGIHPTDFELNPTKIPPGGVVQNCRGLMIFILIASVFSCFNVPNVEETEEKEEKEMVDKDNLVQ